MGYDLHITRRAEWADDQGPEITLKEWRAYLKSDAQIERDAANGPTDFLFTAHPEEPKPLWWDRGEIYTKNPDEVTIRKLVQISKNLKARVVGDDGEEYT